MAQTLFLSPMEATANKMERMRSTTGDLVEYFWMWIVVAGLALGNVLYWSVKPAIYLWKSRVAIGRAIGAILTDWLVAVWAISVASIYGAYTVPWMKEVSSFPFAIGKMAVLLTFARLIFGNKFDGIHFSTFHGDPKAYAIVLTALILSAVYIIVNS